MLEAKLQHLHESLPPHREVPHPELLGVYIFKSAADVGQAGAQIVTRTLRIHPDAHICSATGETQKPLFTAMRDYYAKGWLKPEDATWSHLDERAGLGQEDTDSFAHELITELWGPLRISEHHYHKIQGDGDPEAVIQDLQRFLKNHPRTLTFAGLGEDDHLAFVMKGDPEAKHAHYVVQLSPHVVERDFKRTGRTLPGAFTMGIDDIIETDLLVMLVTGAHKADAVKRMLSNPMDLNTPSAYIRQRHNAIVLLDRKAAQNIV